MTARRIWAVLAAMAAVAGTGIGWALAADARGPEGMSLGFTSRTASPVVVTGFAIEQPLAPVAPFIASGAADLDDPRVPGATSAISAPRDAGGDGLWVISAQWVELPTGKAWQASVKVPVRRLSVAFGAYELAVIFGPDGEMLIASDQTDATPVPRVDAARVCGTRVPRADRNWQAQTGQFPELPQIMAFSRQNRDRVTQPRFCPAQRKGTP